MQHLGTTTPFRGPAGEVLPGSIADVSYVRLGGLEQWVLVRGEGVGNPPLILLHGGPGFPEAPFFRHFNAVLEHAFTVVYWDQRGSGKSFASDIPRSSMTVEQFIADLDEFVDHVRARVGQPRVAIFGHSWGTLLGALYAARAPHKVSVYVGCGQIGNWPAAEAASYAFAVAEAERLHHRRAIEELRAIGPPPYSADGVFKERTWLSRFEGHMGVRSLWEIGQILVEGPEFSVFDLPNLVRGFRFSLDAMWPEVSRLDLIELVPALPVPAFFFLGRQDHWVPPETSMAFIEAVQAPAKTVIWFDTAGHELFADEPEKFNAAMVDLVRPAIDAGHREA